MSRTSDQRDTIFMQAQRQLYNVGYINFSMKGLADGLNIPPSLVSYYFRQKKYLAEEVYLQLETNVHEAISDVIGRIENPLLFYLTSRYIMGEENKKDANIERLRYEMLKKEDFGFARIDNYKILVKQISDYYHLDSTHLDVSVLGVIQYNATREIFLAEHNGEIKPENDDKAFSTLEGITARSVGVPEIEIQKQLVLTRENAQKVLDSVGGDVSRLFFYNFP